MMHPFETLRAEYATLLAQMRVVRVEEVDAAARKLLNCVADGRYDVPCAATGVPKIVAASSFEREASSNFTRSPAQGDPWDRVSVHVPRGIGPFTSWAEAAIAAYKIERWDAVGWANWTWERSCFELEAFNGFGYRAHGVHSPYLWAGTNVYSRGKFTADGRFDQNAVDHQIGVVPIMRRMVDVNPSLALSAPPPARSQGIADSAPPSPVRWTSDAMRLQVALNALGADPPLLVDGNYGRMTRAAVRAFQGRAGVAVDGFVGPHTSAALATELARRK